MFLWHAQIEAPKSRLNVTHWNVQLRCGKSTRERSIGVTFHENVSRLCLLDHRFGQSENPRCLETLRLGSEFETIVGSWQSQLFNELLRHVIVIVLSTMNKDEGEISLFEGSD
jgi:hypothetical protein